MSAKAAGHAKKIVCALHPHAVSVGRCVACNQHICASCRTDIAHHPYCPTCARQLIEESVELAVVKGEAAHERRRFPRVSTVVLVKFVPNPDANSKTAPSEGVLVNINMGGMGLLTTERLREQTQMRMFFTLPNQLTELNVQAGIMHTKDLSTNYFYSGVTFMNLGDTAILIEDFLRQRTTKRYVKLDKKVSFV